MRVEQIPFANGKSSATRRYVVRGIDAAGRDIALVVAVHFDHWLAHFLGRWAITLGFFGFHVYAIGLTLPALVFAEEVGHAVEWQERGPLFAVSYLWGARHGYAANPWEIRRKAWAAANVADFQDVPWNDPVPSGDLP